MRVVSGYVDLPASVPRLICSVPVQDLHTMSITANGACYVGGADVQAGTGMNLQLQDTLSFKWQDFRPNDNSLLDLYAIAPADTSVNFLIWKR